MVEVCMFNLSKPGGGKLVDLLEKERGKKKAEAAYLWASDGNTQILKDRYDDKLIHLDPKAVLKALRADHKKTNRAIYGMVITYLEKAIEVYGDGILSCVLFGY